MMKNFNAPIGRIEDESGTMNPVFSENSYNKFKKGAKDTLDIAKQVCPIAIR